MRFSRAPRMGGAFALLVAASCARIQEDAPAGLPVTDGGSATPPSSSDDAGAVFDAAVVWTEVPVEGDFELAVDAGTDADAPVCGSGWSSTNASLSSSAHAGQAACRICGGLVGARLVRRWLPGEVGPGSYRLTYWVSASATPPAGLFVSASVSASDGKTQGASLRLDVEAVWRLGELVFSVPPGVGLSELRLGFADIDGNYCVTYDDVRLEKAN